MGRNHPSDNACAHSVPRASEPRTSEVLSYRTCHHFRHVPCFGKMQGRASLLSGLQPSPPMVDNESLGEETQNSRTSYLDEHNALKSLNDMLFWADLEKRRTRERWAQSFFELRKENIQWMFDQFISKDAIVRGDRQLVLPLLGIQGICLYAPIGVLRQFGRRQTIPPEACYRIYVFDIGDDRVPEASKMLREWKRAMRMKEDTIAADRFNVGYDETYKAWLKGNIQGISFSVPNIYRSVEDKESKALIELREVRKEAQEIHDEFL
ncbi:hypothetical protein KY290_031542 [Solanum tuberosum]|uniref:DUF7745 domain-containing protein n=1 Tax=Solanum tuberosum TaxID=4113 RepID=A0ABQ7UA77_SOLTU|nr:hypothetical protein KY290_031542 [Solanum tuberosum]